MARRPALTAPHRAGLTLRQPGGVGQPERDLGADPVQADGVDRAHSVEVRMLA
ncbi:hypothetical protein [Lapillicoccus sp.]|uniref:hypothetical protein n=1 Tax=Lapillicoccus sp. TaxID=1909287 RepID=UPI0039836558